MLKIINRVFNLLVLSVIKIWARTIYRVENRWLHTHREDPWEGVRLIIFLNHTSLYEFLFLGAVPWRFIARLAGRMVVPAANTTINRPIVGRLFKFFGTGLIPISRERDATWDYFLQKVNEDSVVIILPEGRMKRLTGLDKNGKPMSVRGGVADILQMMETGKMVIVYSGGLHHVQAPGQWIPKPFKTISLHTQKLDIADYIQQMKSVPDKDFKKAVMADLQERLARFKPNERY